MQAKEFVVNEIEPLPDDLCFPALLYLGSITTPQEKIRLELLPLRPGFTALEAALRYPSKRGISPWTYGPGANG